MAIKVSRQTRLLCSHVFGLLACDLLILSISQVSSPTIIVERAGSYAWAHKSWRVREEFVRTVATAVGLFASTELPLQRVLLSPVSLGFEMVTILLLLCIAPTLFHSIDRYAKIFWLYRSCNWWMIQTKALEKLLSRVLRLAEFIPYIPASADAFHFFPTHVPFDFYLTVCWTFLF